jgi:nitroreductase
MLDVIKKRRSHRDFLNKPVEDEKIKEILKAAMFVPSARNQRLWEFIVVKDQKTKDALAQTKQHSAFVNKAPVIIVIISRTEGPNPFWWLEDAFIVANQIYLEATNQELGTCCIQIYGSKRESGEDAEAYIKKVLQIPEYFGVACIMPIGYPIEILPEHRDSEFEIEKVHYEKYT